MFYSNGEKKHYAWIKNFDKLMVHKGNSTHTCEYCMNPFQSLQALRNHEKFCDLLDGFRRDLTEKGTMLRFGPVNPNDDWTKQIQSQLNKSMRAPVVFYADF